MCSIKSCDYFPPHFAKQKNSSSKPKKLLDNQVIHVVYGSCVIFLVSTGAFLVEIEL